MTDFISNWQRNKFKSKEDAVLYAISKLMEDGRRIKRLGLSDELVVTWKGKTIKIA